MCACTCPCTIFVHTSAWMASYFWKRRELRLLVAQQNQTEEGRGGANSTDWLLLRGQASCRVWSIQTLIQFPNLHLALPAPISSLKSSLIQDFSSRTSLETFEIYVFKVGTNPLSPQNKKPCFGISVSLQPASQLFKPNIWESPPLSFLFCIQGLSHHHLPLDSGPPASPVTLHPSQ